jgi:hypothetical protein
MMDRVLQKHAAINIICGADNPETIEARHSEMSTKRDELFSTGMLKVAEKFHNLTSGSDAKHADYMDDVSNLKSFRYRQDVIVYRIEHEGKDLEHFANRVAERLELVQETQYQPALNPKDHNVLGHLRPAYYLIVGDEVNPKSNVLRWPFYDYGHSSLFLCDKLHQINFDETTAMWTNDNNAHEHIENILKTKRLKVITLGKLAEKRVKSMKIPIHASLPHPQWVKRFAPTSSYHKDLRLALMT